MSTPWEKAIERLLADTKLGVHAPGPVVRNFGDAPTVVLVGPTGSGKTSFVNLWLGVRLLPEGLGHTTPVPTIISRDDTPRLVALSADARPIDGIPIIELPREAFDELARDSREAVLARMLRKPDPAEQRRMHDVFWKPAFDAARANQCVAISLSAPLSWLPEGVRVVDMPGYEGWYPDETPDLHQLVTRWLDSADMALFIASVNRLKVGYSTEFMNYHRSKGGPLALWVNQIDNITMGDDWQTMLREYRGDVVEHLQSQGFKEIDNLGIYMGCTRLDRESKLGDALDHVLDHMSAAGQEFRHVLQLLHEQWSNRRHEQHLQQQAKTAKETCEVLEQQRQRLQEACDKGLEKARRQYVNESTQELVESVNRAIDRTNDPMHLQHAIEETLREMILQRQRKVVNEYWSDLEQTTRADLRGRFGDQVSAAAFDQAFNTKHQELESFFGADKSAFFDAVKKVAAAGNPTDVGDWFYLIWDPADRVRRIKKEAKNQVQHLISSAMLDHTFKPLEKLLKKDFARVWNGKDGIEASLRSTIDRRASERLCQNLMGSASSSGTWLLHQSSPGDTRLIRLADGHASDNRTVHRLAIPEMGSRPVAAVTSAGQHASWFAYTDVGGRIISLAVSHDGDFQWQNVTLRCGWAPRSASRVWACEDGAKRIFYVCENGNIQKLSVTEEGSVHRLVKKLGPADRPESGLAGYRDSKGIILVYRDSSGHIQLLNEADHWKRKDLSVAAGEPPRAHGDPFLYRYIDGLHVVYRGKNGHLHELLQRGTAWVHHALTKNFEFPKAAGNPIAHADENQFLYYRGIDEHMHELIWTGSTWHHHQLTGTIEAPAMLSDAVLIVGHTRTVVFAGQDQSLHRLECRDGHWKHLVFEAWER